MHVALIDASLGTPHARRNFTREFEDTLGDTVTVFEANEGELPPPASAPPSVQDDTDVGGAAANADDDIVPIFPFDAVVISGSQSSVYDELEWIEPLKAWTDGAIRADVPILGVCWGFQLLADVLGGSVQGAEYELGYVEVHPATDDPILSGLDDPFTAFATHSDYVTELPDDVTLLAENDAGPQAFRKGSVYATQFHPEYDLRTAEAMIRSKDLPMREIQRALDTCTPENVQAAQRTKQLFRNFHNLVADNRVVASG